MTPPVSLPMGGEAVSFDQWDMDLDGDLDIVAVVVDEFSQASVIRVLRNDSTAQQLAFTLMPDLAENENARLVRGADVTGDALEDLIAVNITQQLAGGGSLLAIRPALLKGPTPCVADINNDHVVNVSDLLAVIAAWGPCPGACPPNCAADIVPNCAVNVSDLLAVISNWGACPK
jgi:hypothetical protein